MLLGLGKESISIMFAIFSVGVTLFASSPQFTFDNGNDDNKIRKLNFLNDFDNTTKDVKEIEKFILYNADLSQNMQKLSNHKLSLDYQKSIDKYNSVKNNFFKNDRMMLDLAMIPVYYNVGDIDNAKILLDKIKSPFVGYFLVVPHHGNVVDGITTYEINQSVSDLLDKSSGILLEQHFSINEDLFMRYWYADYTLNNLKEFPGCKQEIFPKKILDNTSQNNKKCTHKELSFIDSYINDLNYDSYYFDVGNKYQKNSYSYYQDEIKTFFASYMNWLIIGVVLITLGGWVSISKKQETQ